MAEPVDVQAEAAELAAKARQALAKRIAKLAPTAEQQSESQVILHLAEAYAHLAAEPPRARAG
jgi:DNA/RNA-binding domain of Phe-tRNA-synthetase-like protein